VAPGATPAAKLDFRRGRRRLMAEDADLGEGHGDLDVAYDGAPLVVGFNADCLVELLDTMAATQCPARASPTFAVTRSKWWRSLRFSRLGRHEGTRMSELRQGACFSGMAAPAPRCSAVADPLVHWTCGLQREASFKQVANRGGPHGVRISC
jgi:hypothetical protein